MQLYVYNLRGTLFEGPTDSVVLPAADGEITVLNGHMQLVTALTKGTVRTHSEDEAKEIPVGGGFAYTDGKRLIVLAE